MCRSVMLPLLAVCLLAGAASAAKVTLTQQGIAIDAGQMGQFNLDYPQLETAPNKLAKPSEVKLQGNHADLGYEGGRKLGVDLAGGEVTFRFGGKPPVKMMRVEGLLGFELANGGSWRIDGNDFKPFPAVKPEKPFLWQNNSGSLTIKAIDGHTLTWTLPPWSWLQLQDNREWGWKTFAWFFQVPLNDASDYTLKISDDASAATGPKVLCDRFGQNALQEFPGKVKSVDELKADVAAEAAWEAGLKRPATGAYGGQPGSGAKLGLKATGFFHVEQHGQTWVLVDPDGNAFFHRGICGFQPSDDYTFIAGRPQIYEWLPPAGGEYASAFRPGDNSAFSFYVANVIRKYGKPYNAEEFTARMIPRVRSWGFTSVGAFSGVPKSVRDAAKFPYVAHLPLDPWNGGITRLPGINETWDPFDEAIRAKVDQNFAAGLPASANDPLLIGYYLVNEPAYEDIPRVVPTLSGKYACKRKLVALLQAKYPSIDAFNTAWGLKAASFDALADMGLPVTTQAASDDVHAFTGEFFETYFKLVTETFRKYDSKHMLIGVRLQPGTINNEQLCRAAGRYMDIMSFNYYTYGIDKDLLKRIYSWTGKPFFLSEFHYSSPLDSGLPGGAKDVASQEERGLGYRNYLEQSAATGLVVGLEWFTLIDQAQTGRWFSKYNGENGNTGLVNVADRPWKTMLEHMIQSNDRVYDVWLHGAAPFAYDNPRFAAKGSGARVAKIPRAAGAIKLDGSTAGWPGTPPDAIDPSRLVSGAAAGGVATTFKLCWDDTNLYLLANVTDPTPMLNEHTGDMIWSADALELFVGWEKPEQTGALLFTDRQILLSAGKVNGQPQWFFAHAPKPEKLDLVVLPNVAGKGYTLEAAIPFASLGFKPKAGQTIRFDLALDDSSDGKARRCQLAWNGSERSSGDRTAWGTAVFNQ